MVCRYHQLCRQRMSAFQIYYHSFEQISSHFAFCPIAQSVLTALPRSAPYSHSLMLGSRSKTVLSHG